MPTGYTAPVQAGKITTLSDYALACARAFGALIDMRDAPTGAVIPNNLEPHTEYYDGMIAGAEGMLARVTAMTVAELDAAADADFREALDSHLGHVADRAGYKTRYSNMLAKVRAWSVPDDLASLKAFMENQLVDSMQVDCGERYPPEPPVRLTGDDWKAAQLRKASHDLAYGHDHRDQEVKRTAERNEWLQQLRASL